VQAKSKSIFNFMTPSAPNAAAPDIDDCRCVCGSLLARLVDGGVELFCRRCKRTHWIALTPRPEAQSPEPHRSRPSGALEARWLDRPGSRS
jgi:hypothetical protein